jgi:hypothetical protein
VFFKPVPPVFSVCDVERLGNFHNDLGLQDFR